MRSLPAISMPGNSVGGSDSIIFDPYRPVFRRSSSELDPRLPFKSSPNMQALSTSSDRPERLAWLCRLFGLVRALPHDEVVSFDLDSGPLRALPRCPRLRLVVSDGRSHHVEYVPHALR